MLRLETASKTEADSTEVAHRLADWPGRQILTQLDAWLPSVTVVGKDLHRSDTQGQGHSGHYVCCWNYRSSKAQLSSGDKHSSLQPCHVLAQCCSMTQALLGDCAFGCKNKTCRTINVPKQVWSLLAVTASRVRALVRVLAALLLISSLLKCLRDHRRQA